MRILGIDPSIRRTGYAIIEAEGGKLRALTFGAVANKASLSQGACLLQIHERLCEIIEEWQPEAAALEAIVYAQNTRTSIVMGAARGAALMAATRHGLELAEYPPKSVKKGATGIGGARKNQVGFMMRAILGLQETPGADEADALAVALTHAQALPTRRPEVTKKPKRKPL